MELTWEPPAAAAQPADQVQSADFDIAVLLTETAIESTAKIKLRGPARTWKLVAPFNAELSVERATATADVGPPQLPAVTKPTDQNKPVWKIDLPGGTSANDWQVTAVTRQTRAKTDDPKHRGPFPIGPFLVLDMLRQTGTVRVTAGPHTHLTFKHGLDLRQTLAPGPVEDDVTNAFFRLTTGPTGTTAPNLPQPLFSVEALPQVGSIVVKPTYKLTLEKVPLSDDFVWRIRAEIRVTPNHTTVDALAIEFPAEWPEGAEASFPSESLPGIPLGFKTEGFWSTLATKFNKDLRIPTILQLPTGQKQAFDLILTAIVRIPPGTSKIAIPLPRFPAAVERDVTIQASVPEGLEIRESEARNLDGEPRTNRGIFLTPVIGQNGKPNKVVTAVKGESETPLSQVILGWNAYRPEMTAEINADVTLSDHQTAIVEQIKLRATEGLPRLVRFRVAHSGVVIAGLKVAKGQLQRQTSPEEWTLALPTDTKEVFLDISYAIAHDRHPIEQPKWNLPIAIVWPIGATQSDTTVRFWSNTSTPRKLANLTKDWRELTVEPVLNRDVIPSLALAAAGSELPLVVEAREIDVLSSTSVWVDRATIQAWGTEDGGTHYRARFLLHKWVGPTVDVRIPGSVANPGPEFFGDGLRIVDVTPTPESSWNERAYRISLEPFAGKSMTLEVRYQTPPANAEIGEAVYWPAQIANAALASPTRWQVTVSHGTIPIFIGGATPEFHWRLLSRGLLPVPVRSTEDEHYSEESNTNQEDSITARQTFPAPITIYRFPRNGLVILCSVTLFFVFLLLIRLPSMAIGIGIAVLGFMTGSMAILFPHATAQIAGACQPGLVLAIVVVLVQAAIRSYRRHRTAHLPGFSRFPIELSGLANAPPSSTRSRPSGVGSVGAAPVAPTGG